MALTDARAIPAASGEALRVLGGALLDDVDGLADRLTVMVLQREPVYAERDMVDESVWFPRPRDEVGQIALGTRAAAVALDC